MILSNPCIYYRHIIFTIIVHLYDITIINTLCERDVYHRSHYYDDNMKKLLLRVFQNEIEQKFTKNLA